MGRAERRRSPFAASVVLGAAVGVFGMSFGVLAVGSGLSVAKACAMSLLVFTGASQFAAAGVVGGGGSPVAALGSAMLLAARNGAYGLAMSPVVKGSLGRRLLAAHFVLDESTAMSLAQHDERDRLQAFWLTGLSVFVFWNIGTLAGALFGSALGDPKTLGLDAAFPAGFVSLLLAHVRKVEGRIAAVLGALIALVLIPLMPAGVPILASGLAALVGLRRPRSAEVIA